MKAIAPFAIPTIFLNSVIVCFGISPTLGAMIFTVVTSFILGCCLSLLYKQQSWIIPGVISLGFPIMGFLILGKWWQATFSWDLSYSPPLYWTALLFAAWTMILSAPYILLFCLINGLRSIMRNTAEQDAAANP